ncbi:bifunctional glutathionylspermidine amidase/glutathionylspermidine synthetase [Thraustotheca clavata]|uniref:Bifunctional glutathionylspermidine amidase/glutathionylspermidine synthetase n=1 Tax=Thraustotheca clavata TaxID=74557 RepID=A0A1W0AA07_9STRA|nr:bifunctional glutathionylspermidine amidase/glutathionylspermidine synthetase [Thraustotheca clavata]
MQQRACLLVLTLCLSVIAALKPAPFGTLLGVTDGGVEVYSCQLPEGAEALDMDPNYVDGVYTGVRWQCVELGRRYLYVNYGVVFGSVDYAFQIFDLPTFKRIATQAPVAITKHPNGSPEPPAHGSLLIWSPYGEMAETGHVAVVVNATDTFVDIVEQNVEDIIWPHGQQYSRRLQVERNATSYFIKKWYDEEHIIGWVTIDNAESNLAASSNFGSIFYASFIITIGATALLVYRQRSRRTDRYNQYNLVK